MRLLHDLLHWTSARKTRSFCAVTMACPACISKNEFALVIWTPMPFSSPYENGKLALAQVEGKRLLNLVGSVLCCCDPSKDRWSNIQIKAHSFPELGLLLEQHCVCKRCKQGSWRWLDQINIKKKFYHAIKQARTSPLNIYWKNWNQPKPLITSMASHQRLW